MGYYSTISGNISGITSKGYNSIKEDLKSVFDEADWDECNGGTLMIHSNAKHYDDYTHPVYDKIAAVLSAKEGHGELEEQGEESGDISIIYFIKDNWKQLWAEVIYPRNPFIPKTKV